jgi:hypothetical protein
MPSLVRALLVAVLAAGGTLLLGLRLESVALYAAAVPMGLSTYLLFSLQRRGLGTTDERYQ